MRFAAAVSKIFIAKSWLALIGEPRKRVAGPPFVSVKFISNCLNDEVSVKKSEIVNACAIIGISMRKIRVK